MFLFVQKINTTQSRTIDYLYNLKTNSLIDLETYKERVYDINIDIDFLVRNSYTFYDRQNNSYIMNYLNTIEYFAIVRSPLDHINNNIPVLINKYQIRSNSSFIPLESIHDYLDQLIYHCISLDHARTINLNLENLIFKTL